MSVEKNVSHVCSTAFHWIGKFTLSDLVFYVIQNTGVVGVANFIQVPEGIYLLSLILR